MEWVEAQAKTVDGAVQAALDELGLASKDQAKIEIVQEPKRGMLGIGGQLAVVKVTKVEQQKRRRKRRRGKGAGSGDRQAEKSGGKPSAQKDGGQRDGGDGGQRGGGQRGGTQRGGGQRSEERGDGRKKDSSRPAGGRSQDDKARSGSNRGRGNQSRSNQGGNRGKAEPAVDVDINEQAEVGQQFVSGLLDAFGLEGSVATRVEDDVLHIDVTGDQTEALVGPKGVIMDAIKELTRTVIQRKTHGAPRMRLDVGGYTERRREALKIYAGKLAEQLLNEGGEAALEPMNPADRKVLHDAVAEIDGVRSFSEGEDPRRYVVLALEDGVAPRNESADPTDEAAGTDTAGDATSGDDTAGDGTADASAGGDEALSDEGALDVDDDDAADAATSDGDAEE